MQQITYVPCCWRFSIFDSKPAIVGLSVGSISLTRYRIRWGIVTAASPQCVVCTLDKLSITVQVCYPKNSCLITPHVHQHTCWAGFDAVLSSSCILLMLLMAFAMLLYVAVTIQNKHLHHQVDWYSYLSKSGADAFGQRRRDACSQTGDEGVQGFSSIVPSLGIIMGEHFRDGYLCRVLVSTTEGG
ncbi:hypothetical protein J5N97_018714 [Dioscorea zingiberensis]|uniref:Uncharacterized protein n=1 Tax=Dioscorea zingiberensis TaxID=325984 RepID=A0A9D5HC07_9LILI|nr:hypothetical protein J5N97_018714 [Dioscorea zingiberensis]